MVWSARGCFCGGPRAHVATCLDLSTLATRVVNMIQEHDESGCCLPCLTLPSTVLRQLKPLYGDCLFSYMGCTLLGGIQFCLYVSVSFRSIFQVFTLYLSSVHQYNIDDLYLCKSSVLLLKHSLSFPFILLAKTTPSPRGPSIPLPCFSMNWLLLSLLSVLLYSSRSAHTNNWAVIVDASR